MLAGVLAAERLAIDDLAERVPHLQCRCLAAVEAVGDLRAVAPAVAVRADGGRGHRHDPRVQAGDRDSRLAGPGPVAGDGVAAEVGAHGVEAVPETLGVQRDRIRRRGVGGDAGPAGCAVDREPDGRAGGCVRRRGKRVAAHLLAGHRCGERGCRVVDGHRDGRRVPRTGRSTLQSAAVTGWRPPRPYVGKVALATPPETATFCARSPRPSRTRGAVLDDGDRHGAADDRAVRRCRRSPVPFPAAGSRARGRRAAGRGRSRSGPCRRRSDERLLQVGGGAAGPVGGQQRRGAGDQRSGVRRPVGHLVAPAGGGHDDRTTGSGQVDPRAEAGERRPDGAVAGGGADRDDAGESCRELLGRRCPRCRRRRPPARRAPRRRRRRPLQPVGGRAAEAEVDDVGAVVDRPDDAGSQVVGEDPAGHVGDLDGEQAGVAPGAGDADAVAGRGRRHARRPGAVADDVVDVGAAG